MKKVNVLFLAVVALLLLSLVFASPVGAQDQSDPEANKEVVLAFIEAEATRDYDRMNELFAEDFVRHSVATTAIMPEVEVTSLNAYKGLIQGFVAQFPDYRNQVQMIAAEGDLVALYTAWTGTDAQSGNSITSPMVWFVRIEAGKIAELWIEWENLTFGGQLQQGAPTPQISPYEPPVEEDFDLDANKALVSAFAEAELSRDYDALEDLVAPDFVRHSTATPDVQVNSREGFAAFLQATAEQFPDYTNTVQMMVAENDLVALYTVMSGTFAGADRAVEFPHIDFFRIEDGQIAELWVEWDNMTLLTQMGLFPPPQAEALPVGTYTTTITPEDLNAADFQYPTDLEGTWEIQVSETGMINWTYRNTIRNREFGISTEFSATDSTLVLSAETGEHSCNEMYDMTSATYNWALDGEQLLLTNIDDVCTQRMIVLTSHPLTRLTETESP